MARARTGDATKKPKVRSDAYVGILILALLAQIAGGVFLYLDWSAYPPGKPPALPTAPSASTPAPAPAPVPGPGGGQVPPPPPGP